MKIYSLLFGLASIVVTQAQNVGINQNSPTNSLHISPINTGNDPLRIDGMQSYVSGDTTLMIIDNTTGIVRYVAKSDLGSMIGNILFQDSDFTNNLNTYVTNNTGSDTDVDSARVVGNTLQIFENGTMITADLTNVTGTTYTGGTGISISGSTITNTAPDQTVAITGTGGTTVTGTYPNFSIASTDNQTLGSTSTTITLTNGGSIPFSTLNANDWHTNGNAGTNGPTDFLGTTDNKPLVFKTNNLERMRIANGGVVMINTTTPLGVFTTAGGTLGAIVGVSTTADGVSGTSTGATNFGLWAKNSNTSGTGLISAGNNQTGSYLTTGTGGAFTGVDGSFSKATSTTGTGVIGLGNNLTSSSNLTSGSGGAFTGNDGVYGKGVVSTGTGVIGVGNNLTTYSTSLTGTGGAFSGNDGVYAKGVVSTGTGVIGVGNNLTSYSSLTSGSGGMFTGTSIGIYGKATNTSGTGPWGIGVYGDGAQFGLFSQTTLGANGTKSFIIDHPLDPENKFLKHYSMESPEVINFYRGIFI